MNPDVFLASVSADLQTAARTTAESFGLKWPLFLAQVVSFGIVASLLHWFAYKPILKMLEERRQRIKESLDNAETIKAELARTESARREILDQAHAQATRLIAEARAAAGQVQEAEIQKALAAAQQLLARARESAAQDHARMMAELRQEIGRLVVETTAKVSGKVLTPADHQRLVEETAHQLTP